ncbi:hypothetical protein [Paenibacillus luteus]|uniref:hypothetical protein n=1 Tax=Paenibacillus luteus TaxID=2545753 RepID=UPI0011411F14|nr:hypothetical protein [Paenibacillus luteus]
MKLINVANLTADLLDEEYKENQINCDHCDRYEDEVKIMYQLQLQEHFKMFVCEHCVAEMSSLLSNAEQPSANIENADEARKMAV